jgi:hypothetical protein
MAMWLYWMGPGGRVEDHLWEHFWLPRLILVSQGGAVWLLFPFAHVSCVYSFSLLPDQAAWPLHNCQGWCWGRVQVSSVHRPASAPLPHLSPQPHLFLLYWRRQGPLPSLSHGSIFPRASFSSPLACCFTDGRKALPFTTHMTWGQSL